MRLDGEGAVKRHVLRQGAVHADFERERIFREDFRHARREDFVRHIERVEIDHFAFHLDATLTEASGLSSRPERRGATERAGYEEMSRTVANSSSTSSGVVAQ